VSLIFRVLLNPLVFYRVLRSPFFLLLAVGHTFFNIFWMAYHLVGNGIDEFEQLNSCISIIILSLILQDEPLHYL
jgi:hypothetical protein